MGIVTGIAMSSVILPGSSGPAPRLLDQVQGLALARFARPEPGERYAHWTRRYILFHGTRHRRELGMVEIGRFLEHLAQSEEDPLRSLEQAREALGFLYDAVIGMPMGELPFPEPPRLLDRVRRALRVRRYSPRTGARPGGKCRRR
jgi:hypothetical protein